MNQFIVWFKVSVTKMQLIVSIFLLFALLSSTISLPVHETLDTSLRIVNGYEIDINQIPYHAALRRRVATGWTYTCGAAVITVRALLTAAHCVDNSAFDPSSLRVVVGSSSRLSGGKTYDLSRVAIHETYSAETLTNDIAMLVTDKKMSFSQSVSAINFAPSNFNLPSGTEALVSGYGLTSVEGSASSVLLAARVNIVAQETCARAYLRITTISTGMICANAVNPPRDACQGDSGGPLVANGLLIGLVSWGEGCANPSYPGVYTRVSEYNSWIRQKLGQIY